MKKNKTICLLLGLIWIGLILSCSSLRKPETSANDNQISKANGNQTSNSNSTSISPTIAKVDCPQTPLSVNETKDKALEKYEGCVISIQGKIWSLTNTTATLIDTYERTDYNYSLSLGGNFSGGTYSDIALKISQMKINQQYDKLPVVTFTGTVEKNSGYTSLKNSVLTNVQR